MSVRQGMAFFALVALALVPPPTHATECDDCDYKKRDNRFEGVAAIGVAAPDFELVSFTSHRSTIPSGADTTLTLSFYLDDAKELFIVARELAPQEYYVMRPATTSWSEGWQRFSPWPTAPVMNPLGIGLAELGVLGRVGQEEPGSSEVVPIAVFASPPADSISEYTLHFRPRVNLKEVHYILIRDRDDERVVDETIEQIFYGGQPFALRLGVRGFEEGRYRLVVVCRFKNRLGQITRTYTFYHRAVAGG